VPLTPPKKSLAVWSRENRTQLVQVLGLAVFAATVLGYEAVGQGFYGNFQVPQGVGMTHILPPELAHWAVFVWFGFVAWLALFAVLRAGSLGQQLQRLFAHCSRHALATAAAVAVGAACLSWVLGAFWLKGAAITDDEHAYRFIAQTLRTGRLTAASPGEDLEFFKERFIVLSPTVRYGKYPIGHPLVLAVGQMLGAESLVVPLLVLSTLILLYVIARELSDDGVALLAVLLLGTSPQFILTGSTILSQVPAAVCVLAGTVGLLRAERAARFGSWWALGAGLAFGYGVLTRPLPLLLCAGAGLGYLLWCRRGAGRRSWWDVAALCIPVVAAIAAQLAINHAQSGSWLTSGYASYHAPERVGLDALTVHVGGGGAAIAMSLLAAAVRLSVWLFGWPNSLVFLAFAGRRARWVLIWLMIGAAVVYRCVSPKAGVGTVGPIYMFEVIPLLALLSAHGVAALVRSRQGERWTVPRREMAAALVAGLVVSGRMFIPPKLRDLSRAAEAQRELPRVIAAHQVRHAVVFHLGLAPPWTGSTWAYFPRCNSPKLDDEVLLLWMPLEPQGYRRSVELWRRRFPDRTAWFFSVLHGQALLTPLGDAEWLVNESIDAIKRNAPPPAPAAR
jgi:hypothetical protein